MEGKIPLLIDDSDSSSEVIIEFKRDPKKSYLEDLDIDTLLEKRLGFFGYYQKWMFILVSFPTLFTACIVMSSVFTSIVPQHRCYIPNCDQPTSMAKYGDVTNFYNFTIPQTKEKTLDSCHRYQEISDDKCSDLDFNKNIVGCSSYVFNEVDMEYTMPMRFNLVCEDSGKVDLSQSIFFAGVLVGASMFGQLGDLYGRKPALIISLTQNITCALFALLAPNLIIYNGFQFLTAMGSVGVFQTSFLLGVELVGAKYRVFCGVIMNVFGVVGYLLLAFLAWYYRHWIKMSLAYIIPSFLFLGYYFILPRSIRWLLANKRYLEAESELQKVAKWNKVPPLTQEDFMSHKKKVEVIKKESFTDLLKRSKLVLRLFIVFICWVVCTMVYYGLSLSASTLGGDVFVNFSLLSLTEIPGYVIAYYGMETYGRKPSMICSLLISGIACLLSAMLPNNVSTSHCSFLCRQVWNHFSLHYCLFIY